MKSSISNASLPYAQTTECDSSSSQGSAAPVAPWDTKFNRALNITKGKEDPQARPTSADRVPGFGAKSWTEHYGSKRGKKAESAEVLYLRSQVEKFPELLQEAAKTAANNAIKLERAQAAAVVDDKVNEKLNTILPAYMEQYSKWRKGGKQGPCPVPSITSAGSDNQQEALVTPTAPEGAPGISLSGLLIREPPAGTMQQGSHSATCAPEDGVVSTLERLNKLKVTN